MCLRRVLHADAPTQLPNSAFPLQHLPPSVYDTATAATQVGHALREIEGMKGKDAVSLEREISKQSAEAQREVVKALIKPIVDSQLLAIDTPNASFHWSPRPTHLRRL